MCGISGMRRVGLRDVTTWLRLLIAAHLCYLPFPIPIVSFVFCFFFSSRRRHTRLSCDWSSDVCSSDLSSDLRDYRVTGVQTCALPIDRKSTRQNSSHTIISYAVFCLDRKSVV